MKVNRQPVQTQPNTQNISLANTTVVLTEQELRAIAGAGLIRNHNETMIDSEDLRSGNTVTDLMSPRFEIGELSEDELVAITGASFNLNDFRGSLGNDTLFIL